MCKNFYINFRTFYLKKYMSFSVFYVNFVLTFDLCVHYMILFGKHHDNCHIFSYGHVTFLSIQSLPVSGFCFFHYTTRFKGNRYNIT